MELISLFLILLAPLAGITGIILFIVRKASKKDKLSNVWRGRYFFIGGFVLLISGVIGVVIFSNTDELASSYNEGREQVVAKATAAKEVSEENDDTSIAEKNNSLDDESEPEEEIDFSKVEYSPQPALKDYVTSFKSDLVVIGDQQFEMIGMDFGPSGVPSILGIDNFDGAFLGQFSFDVGFNKDNKKDAELILFFELNSTKEINPRSEELATLPSVTVIDDQGDVAKEIASVPQKSSEAYYKTDSSIIGAIGYAVYSDAEYFEVNIDDQIQYKLENLNYRTD